MAEDKGEDRLSVRDIDKMIHEPARLLIVAHLYVVESADFLFLMRQTGMTFGNLSSHMSRLDRRVHRRGEGVRWKEAQHQA